MFIKFDEYLNENILLEKSTLTNLGVPREVMQPIQKDLALSPNTQWNKIDYKKDVVDLLRKGTKNLFIQVAIKSIRIFVSYPSAKGTIYFVDKYLYEDTDWSGEYVKQKREFKTLTQLVFEIDYKTNIYHTNDDFSILNQGSRKMIKNEESFTKFTKNFKTDFLKQFDKILKRITGAKFKSAKGEILNKAKRIAIENKMLIKGLDNPLAGPNGMSILDEFIIQFEDEYSNFFDERFDIQELSEHFTKEKTMTMFMYYIYSGKILDK